MRYKEIIREVLEDYRNCPVDILGIGHQFGELNYMQELSESYVRTIRDVDSLFQGKSNSRTVLEIGSFLGPVSIALKRLGYQVFSQDIPEFSSSKSLRAVYDSNGIPFVGVNLRAGSLPYEPKAFDVVIACEVMEHLNFNPLPVFSEINRVLKDDGFLYIGMPNQASIFNRMRILRGRSVHNPIADYFKQLDRSDNMIVGLHWREYTLDETVEIFERMGFAVIESYFYQPEWSASSGLLKRMLKAIVFTYAPFRGFQVVVGRKVAEPTYNFWRTEANS